MITHHFFLPFSQYGICKIMDQPYENKALTEVMLKNARYAIKACQTTSKFMLLRQIICSVLWISQTIDITHIMMYERLPQRP